MPKTLSVIAIILIVAATLPLIGQTSETDRFFSTSVAHSDGNAAITADGPRPLWTAINALEREYGWLIDYEDPIYSQDNESAVQHNSQWESSHPGTPSRIPAGRPFTTNYSDDSKLASSPTGRVSIVQKVVDDFNSSPNAGHFEVHYGGPNRVNIIGQSRSAVRASVLGTQVTPKPGTFSSMEALRELLNTLSTVSEKKVVLGVIPWNLLVRSHVQIKEGSVPARDILTNIADSAGVQLKWDFLYDLDSDSYFLSLRPAPRMSSNSTFQLGNQTKP